MGHTLKKLLNSLLLIGQGDRLLPEGNSHLPLLRTLTPIIWTAASSPAKINYRRLGEITSHFYGLSLLSFCLNSRKSISFNLEKPKSSSIVQGWSVTHSDVLKIYTFNWPFLPAYRDYLSPLTKSQWQSDYRMTNEPYRRLWMGYRQLNYYLISDTPRKYITTTFAHASKNSSTRPQLVQTYPFLFENKHFSLFQKKSRPHKAFSKRCLPSRRLHFCLKMNMF